MDIGETLYVCEREDWRSWLAEHFQDKSEIWLVSYRVATGRPSLPYNDAVEEALCFGWIDSTRKRVDEESYAQRYTPRRAGSSFSQTNKERLARLLERGRVHPSVADDLGDIRPDDYVIPDDILSALRANEAAWAFFQSTSPSYRRIRAAYVDSGRGRPGEFAKRLNSLIDKCARGVHVGYGIETYY